MVPLSFGGHAFLACDAPALFWPRQNMLIVADLHLEKASAFAAMGQMLPPYDSLETLVRLERLVEQTGATRMACLGDNFHDAGGPGRLSGEVHRRLDRLTARCEWWWIAGNHDRQALGRAGGRWTDGLEADGLMLRHEAEPDATGPEMSGHFHPRIRIRARGHSIWRACFLRAQSKLVLPSFGALTGGLDVRHPALRRAFGGQPMEALLPLSDRLARFAL